MQSKTGLKNLRCSISAARSTPEKAKRTGPEPNQWRPPIVKFGNRIDLFSGELGFHASVDFIPHTGTDVIAAASGVVLAAQFHPQYGNVTDPGNGLSTRYGHASVLAAKAGDIV